MIKYDYYWRSNKNWYKMLPSGVYVLAENAPEEARKSYENYKRQHAMKWRQKEKAWKD